MLACPGCGANLTYNIEKGRLYCSYCSSDYAPNDKRLRQKAAGEEELIDAKVFTCPQCGGEMYTTDVDATAYCSYCGASNVLQSRVEGIDAPKKIIPFSVTKKECIDKFNKLAKGTLYAPREFRNGSGEEKLRPLYVPYRIFDLELDGQAEICGKATWIDGAMRITEDRRINCDLNAEFKDLAYDASSAFDDTLAEQIAPFDMKEGRDFDSVYLAGAYANIPDVDAEPYRQKALEYVAQKSVDALQKKSVFEATELADYPDGSSLTDHLPVKKETTYTALLPVWFMSFRRGNRIAYAAVNGESGKVYSDIPVSIPAFWLGSFLTAIPIFAILNLFVTLQPKNGLLVAGFLALVGAILYAGNYISILKREEHLDDVGYRSQATSGVASTSGVAEPSVGQSTSGVTEPSGAKATSGGAESSEDAETSGVGSRLVQWITGHDDVPVAKVKRDWTYYIVKVFSVWPYILMLVLTAILLPTVFWAMVIVGCAVYCLRKTSGRIAFGSGLLILSAAGGLVIRELPLVSDLWYYGGTAAILLILVIALTRLVHQYNLLSTRPLPLLFKDKKESGSSGKKAKPGRSVNGLLVLIAGALSLQLILPFGAKADGAPSGVLFTNSETGYCVVIDDQEDLLTEDEESDLLAQMQGLTQYGNAIFVSCSQFEYEETLDYAKDWYYRYYGNSSGTILMIDMGQRLIALYSAGANNDVIRREEGYVITDNVYTYASEGDYYGCASAAFAQVGTLLEGGKIARPMKYINNALLALILAVLINYGIISWQASKRRTARAMVCGNPNYMPKVKKSRWSATKAVEVFSFTGLCTVLVRFIIEALMEGAFDGDGGSSGGSSGGGGGGASGSGGSHRF